MVLVVLFCTYPAPPELYTLSLHDALPISIERVLEVAERLVRDIGDVGLVRQDDRLRDRKSTRLNSSHANNSYAVFCLKKKTRFDLGVAGAAFHVRQAGDDSVIVAAAERRI